MAELATPYPQDLTQLFSAGPSVLADAGMQQFQAAQQNNQINQDLARQLYQYNQGLNPLLLQHQQGLNNLQQAQTAETNARVPGVAAESGLKQNDLTVSNATLDPRIKDVMSKHFTDISDSDLKQTMNGISQLMVSPSTNERAMGEMLYNHVPEAVLERYKQSAMTDRELAVSQQQGANQRALEQQQAEHGKYLKPYTVDERLKVENELDPVKKYTGFLDLAKKAQAGNNLDDAQYYAARASAMQQAAQAKMASSYAKPGNLDIGQVTGMPTQPNQQLDVNQSLNQENSLKPGSQAQYTPQQQDWIKRAQQANPNMSINDILKEGKQRGKL